MSQKKDEIIKISVSEETKKSIEKAAEETGLSVSSYGRMKIKSELPKEVTA